MKRKITCILASILLLAGATFAEDFSNNGMITEPGDINAFGLVGSGISAGIEKSITSFSIAEIPLTVGAAARVGTGFNFNYVSVEGFGTIHLPLAAFSFSDGNDVLKNIEYYHYIGFGVAVYDGGMSPAFSTIGGISYQFKEDMSICMEGGLGYYGIGVIYSL